MANTIHTLGTLVELARDASAAMPARHQAFAEIVRRFEHLVVACCYARLRDPALAEDAAQDTFLIAWQRLGQLRAPAAFPGWIRRLAMTQCQRRLRGTRPRLRPEEEARNVAATTDPAADAEKTANATLARLALAQLTPNDRLVMMLFYGCERSQAEIADWLNVPVTTISRRLAHAKRRVRQHGLEALSGNLRAHRKTVSRGLPELSARIRGVGDDDAARIARLAGHAGLDGQPRLATSAPGFAYLVEDPVSGTPVAYAAARQTIFRPAYDLQLAIGADALRNHVGDVLLTQIAQDLVATGAITLQHRTSTRHAALVAFLCNRGFAVVERVRDWRLDAKACATLAATRPSRSAWTFSGLETLLHDSTLFDAVRVLLTEAMADDPAERVLLPIHPDALRRGLQVQRDGVLATTGGRLLGLITASTDDATPNALRVNMVLVRQDQRRQGLASALLASLLAKHHGTSARLLAPATVELTAWLASCGFVQLADRLRLERLLRKTVSVAPALLDEYVGRYVVAAKPGEPILIARHGDTLISKTRDMRDVLLASSDSEFFTRHHDGCGRFERDEMGRVVRLVVCEGSREFIAIRR